MRLYKLAGYLTVITKIIEVRISNINMKITED